MEKIIGIDLGTTNSVVAHIEDGFPEVLSDRDGQDITPSVVTITEEGEVVVGRTAKNMMTQVPDRTITSIKRKMGEDYQKNINGENYSPEQISSYILNRLVDISEYNLDSSINKSVITVPAYFNDKQRNATVDAGKIAGLEVERIINEPTAAALAYGISGDTDAKILVYDLGGGTFDVSVLDIGSGLYEIAGTDGINDLGGDDWTMKIVDVLKDEFESKYGEKIVSESSEKRLFDSAEEAKKRLSESTETEVIVPFVKDLDGESASINYEITRTEFEDITSDLLQETRGPVKNALSQADLSKEDIDDVLLVGGATQMPQVRELITETIGIEPRDDIDPNKVVARGAAVQAGILDDNQYGTRIDDIVLLDVTPLSLGVEVEGGVFEPVIERNTIIPAQGKKEFTTAKNSQTTVEVRVYQGERQIATENTLLDKFKLKDIDPMMAGEPEIQVVFSVNENGILTVKAEEKSSQVEKEITIEGGVGMDMEEVESARKDALRHMEEDEIKRNRIRVENRAKSEIDQARNLMDYYDMPQEAEDSIVSKVESLEASIDNENSDLEGVKQKIEELEMELSESMSRYT